MKNIFKAFNDSTRREILNLLKEKDLTAGDISDKFEMSKPSISHHLDILKRADLVSSIKKGQYIYYSINATVLDDILKWLFTLKNNNHENKY